jgi:hypothetical protein
MPQGRLTARGESSIVRMKSWTIHLAFFLMNEVVERCNEEASTISFFILQLHGSCRFGSKKRRSDSVRFGMISTEKIDGFSI